MSSFRFVAALGGARGKAPRVFASSSRRPSIALRVVAALVALSLGGACGKAPRTNVILVVVDTLRADHSVTSATRAATPALDALAADGVRFTEAFSPIPMTLPAHAALFSARTSREIGVRIDGERLPADVPLLAQWMTQHGYASFAAVSLAALRPQEPGSDLARGFERFEYDPTRECEDAPTMKQRFDALLASRPIDRPLFLFAHMSDPHEPYDAVGAARVKATALLDGRDFATLDLAQYAPVEIELELAPGAHVLTIDAAIGFRLRKCEITAPSGALESRLSSSVSSDGAQHVEAEFALVGASAQRCKVRVWAQQTLTPELAAHRYALEVERVDRTLAEFFAGLRAAGLYDESLIVLTSDHGEALGEQGVVGHVVNLRDEMLRVPLIVKTPKDDPARARLAAHASELVRLTDIAPTVLALLDLPPLPGASGRSLLDGGVRELLAETHTPLAPDELLCLRDLRFKLIYDVARERFEMFDVLVNPQESGDVFAQRGDERAEWQTRLRELGRALTKTRTEPTAETLRALRSLGY